MRYTVDVVRFSVAERQMAILTTEKKNNQMIVDKRLKIDILVTFLFDEDSNRQINNRGILVTYL